MLIFGVVFLHFEEGEVFTESFEDAFGGVVSCSVFIWDRLNADSSENDMYIIFVTLQFFWSWNDVLCSLSVMKVLLFVMQMLACMMIVAVSSTCLIASNMF